MKNTIYNALVFNVAWLVCILGGSTIAVPVAVLVITIHLKFFSNHKQEILLIASVVIIGFGLDNMLIRTGLLIAPDNSLWPPLWLISLWGLFATTLNHSMKWFHNHVVVSVVLGGIAGTMTYLAGTRLTDFSLKQPLLTTLVVIFLLWCFIFPACLFFTKKLLPKP